MIKSIKLAFPIERMRGGPVVVGVHVEFQDGSLYAGVSTTNEDTNDAIQEAMNSAVAKAENEHNLRAESTNILIQTVKETALPYVEMEFKRRIESKEIGTDQLELLYGAPDSNKQKELDELCNTLGIDKIDIKTLGWNMLETISCISALTKMVKKLEVKA